MNIFATLVQGDSATWQDDPVELSDGRQADYAGGWTLKYSLRGLAVLDLQATGGTGVTWSTTLATTDSAKLTPGTYAWAAYVSKGAERLTVGGGQLTITADLSTLAAGFDPRTTAQQALEACEAAMATFNATGGKVKKYEIAGRTMEFQTISDLMQLHSFWKIKVTNEQTASNLAQGLGNPRNLYVRHVRPE
jgi:hypothetical protein